VSACDVLLVVDDDTDLRKTMREILEASGYRVEEAGHGKEALTALRAGLRPCLIILDLMMPEMDGYEFKRRHDADPELAQIPVLVVTAFRVPPQWEADATTEVMHKPFDIKRILTVVEKYC
jgi:CheY-like chemotaxis protein